jgi:membrane peptidoglycan carboxypeptidase
MHRMPKANFSQIMEASTSARQEAYKWLFNSRDKAKQDKRIKIMLEQEAFQSIHQHWAKLGYPFASLVPTYATALGSSGDKPIALADFMSIISSGGVRYANTRVTEMHFAEGTPFETKIHAKFDQGTRVLSKEIATTVYDAIQAVVENGTAIRVKGAFVDTDGRPIPVGGKTGTGDNRYSIFAPGGRVIESKVMSRTATFVFYIGDRFFGTLTAYVPNAAAQEFNFTSALPVQILKVLAPNLTPLLRRPPQTVL